MTGAASAKVSVTGCDNPLRPAFFVMKTLRKVVKMSGDVLAWAMTHIKELLEVALLGGSLLPLLIAARISRRLRRAANI